MTEAEWLACEDPTQMLVKIFHSNRASERKLRLLACAIHRRMHHFADEMYVIAAAETSERYADGWATAEEMGEARSAALKLWSLYHIPNSSTARLPRGVVTGAACQVTRKDAAKVMAEIEQVAGLGGVEGRERVNLMRDIFGNPFHPVTVVSSWLTSDVVALAEGIYQKRAFDRTPILADALMDAGCDNSTLLDHCRQPGEHVRGCWVIDLLLGKE